MVIQLSNKTTEELKKEITESGLIPKGTICDFEILESVTMGAKTIYTADATSKKGNDMIVLVAKVYYGEQFKIVIDYLTGGNPRMEFKLRHAMASCGVLGEDGVSAKDFIGKAGKCKIGIQKSEDPNYADKNTIQDYVEKSVAVSATATIDDEIPSFTK